MLINVLGLLVFATVVVWALAAFYLAGTDLSGFDQPTGERFSIGPEPSTEIRAVIATLAGIEATIRAAPLRGRIAAMRKAIDELFSGRELGASFIPINTAGVKGEWVIATGAHSSRRTLYIHGGAFIAGSPLSHRTLTSQFSALTGGAVLAVDYRLMPEHHRMAGIADCRAAYCWMLENGPNGAEPAQSVFVAGDSAGGNLTLSLVAWLRNQGLRLPNAAVALSPATDSTLASPSLKTNMPTDAMLGPVFRPLLHVPRALLLWVGWMQNRIHPANPVISPVYGDLCNLPPILVHASEVEMLFDDSRRYVNRARAAGSPVRLQTWNHMVHVWQLFNPELTEARDALAEIGKFLEAASPRAQQAPLAAIDPA